MSSKPVQTCKGYCGRNSNMATTSTHQYKRRFARRWGGTGEGDSAKKCIPEIRYDHKNLTITGQKESHRCRIGVWNDYGGLIAGSKPAADVGPASGFTNDGMDIRVRNEDF